MKAKTLHEARTLTGNKRLSAHVVAPNSSFRFGFMASNTDFSLCSFEGGLASYKLEQDTGGIEWYAVTFVQGVTLCTWQDPFRTLHHGLFYVNSVSSMSRVTGILNTHLQYWTIMARTNCPVAVIREVAKGAGLHDAEAAIQLAKWAKRKPFMLLDLKILADAGNFAKVRSLLDENFTGFSDSQLINILTGARHYARAIATP